MTYCCKQKAQRTISFPGLELEEQGCTFSKEGELSGIHEGCTKEEQVNNINGIISSKKQMSADKKYKIKSILPRLKEKYMYWYYWVPFGWVVDNMDESNELYVLFCMIYDPVIKPHKEYANFTPKVI